jgi:hypothetical protein
MGQIRSLRKENWQRTRQSCNCLCFWRYDYLSTASGSAQRISPSLAWLELIAEEEVRTYQHGSGGNPAPASIRLTTQGLVKRNARGSPRNLPSKSGFAGMTGFELTVRLPRRQGNHQPPRNLRIKAGRGCVRNSEAGNPPGSEGQVQAVRKSASGRLYSLDGYPGRLLIENGYAQAPVDGNHGGPFHSCVAWSEQQATQAVRDRGNHYRADTSRFQVGKFNRPPIGPGISGPH